EKRSSNEVRDSYEESCYGVGSAAGLQCVCRIEAESNIDESDQRKWHQAEGRRLQTRVGWHRSERGSQYHPGKECSREGSGKGCGPERSFREHGGGREEER